MELDGKYWLNGGTSRFLIPHDSVPMLWLDSKCEEMVLATELLGIP